MIGVFDFHYGQRNSYLVHKTPCNLLDLVIPLGLNQNEGKTCALRCQKLSGKRDWIHPGAFIYGVIMRGTVQSRLEFYTPFLSQRRGSKECSKKCPPEAIDMLWQMTPCFTSVIHKIQLEPQRIDTQWLSDLTNTLHLKRVDYTLLDMHLYFNKIWSPFCAF